MHRFLMLCSHISFLVYFFFFFSSRRRHTRCSRDWSSDVCSSDLGLADQAARALKRLDIVINSSGVMVRQPVETVTPESWDATLDLNLRAMFFVSQGAIPHLRRTKGKIVNMADIAGMEPWPAYVPPCVSKAGA